MSDVRPYKCFKCGTEFERDAKDGHPECPKCKDNTYVYENYKELDLGTMREKPKSKVSKIWGLMKDWWERGYKEGFLSEPSDDDISAFTITLEDRVKEALREAGVDPVTIEKVMREL